MSPHGTAPPVLDRQVDAAMVASRVFVAIVVSSIDGVESLANIRQMRALVTLVEQGPMNVATLAQRLHVHPSNATRVCDQLVETALITREHSARDRRHLVLTANTKGKRLVSKMMDQRRTAVRQVLLEMSEHDRGQLTDGLERFASAAGVPGEGVWSS